MKKINISEEKLKRAIMKVLREEMLNAPNPDNQHQFGRPDSVSEMGVGNDGTEKHEVGIVDNKVKGDQTNYGPNEGMYDIQ